MARKHFYEITVTWTGNSGTGTSSYRDYERSYDLSSPGKTSIAGSSDPASRGNRTRWNPEDLLVASLAACHKLWYLHLCAEAGIIVHAYVDAAKGVMEEAPDGTGKFTQVTLRPRVTVAEGADKEKALSLHESAHSNCFIANSVNFPVLCEPTITG